MAEPKPILSVDISYNEYRGELKAAEVGITEMYSGFSEAYFINPEEWTCSSSDYTTNLQRQFLVHGIPPSQPWFTGITLVAARAIVTKKVLDYRRSRAPCHSKKIYVIVSSNKMVEDLTGIGCDVKNKMDSSSLERCDVYDIFQPVVYRDAHGEAHRPKFHIGCSRTASKQYAAYWRYLQDLMKFMN